MPTIIDAAAPAAGLATSAALATAIACVVVAIALGRLAQRNPGEAFARTLWAGAAFVLTVGLAQLIPPSLPPTSWVRISLTTSAALLGIATAASLWAMLPAILGAPGSAALEGVNRRLHEEILERERAEEEVRRTNAALELRVAERTRELERSNKELEQFAYVASHDLREPLRMITSYTDLIARRYRGRLDATGDEFIAYVLDGCQRMRQLIVDLLEYSRVDRQRMPELVDAEVALAVACHDLAVPIARAEAIITHDHLPPIVCTPSQLVQLLENLLRNALTYRSERPTRVHVGVTETDDEIVISVRDNGLGFEMRHAERIFGMFQRLHVRGEYPGTGMGLALCKKIVESHGGRIWVEAELGVGATFSCAFPRTVQA